MFLKRSVSVIFQNCDLRQKVHFERLGYAVLFLTYRYLCVNSALHYLRPPLRGLKPLKIMPSVHFITLELLPHCGD